MVVSSSVPVVNLDFVRAISAIFVTVVEEAPVLL